MKKILLLIWSALIFGGAVTVFAAPITEYHVTTLPNSNNAFDLGTSTLNWRNIFYNGNLVNSTKTDGCASWASGILTSSGVACGSGGGGSGGGSWSTTTSQVAGRLVNYPNNATDIVNIGSTSTTTGKYWFDPNTARSYLVPNVGIGSTSPSTALVVGGTVTADNFVSTSTSLTTGTSTLAGSLHVGRLFNGQFAPTGFFSTSGYHQVDIGDSVDEGLTLLSVGNRSSGIFAAGCITFINDKTSFEGGINSTYGGNICMAGSNFAALSGLPPNALAIDATDAPIIIAAVSNNYASSTICHASGAGYVTANYDECLASLNPIPYPNSVGYANLGLGSTSPIARLVITSSSTNPVPYFLVASSTNGSNSIIGTVPQQTIFQITSTGIASTTNLNISSITGTTCLQAINGVVSGTGSACGAGGGGGGSAGTFSTSTNAAYGGVFNNYANNVTDIVQFGGITGTSTAKYWFDPNANFSFLTGTTTVTNALIIGTTTALAPLSSAPANGANGTIQQYWYYGGGGPNSANYNLDLKQSTSANVVRWVFDQRNNGTNYQNVLTLDRGNVGIGSTTPYTAFGVTGTIVAAQYIATTSVASIFPYASTTMTTAETASTTNLVVSSITGTTCLQAIAGVVSGTGSACGSGAGSASDWNKQTNFNALTLTPTTTIAIWAKDQIFASSTVTATNFNGYSSTATSTFSQDVVVSKSGTATSTAYIYSKTAAFGGQIIMEDEPGGACTQITTLAGVVRAKVVTCPTEI